MTRYLIGVALLCAGVLAACDKNGVQLLPLDPVASARIKFFNLGVGAPGVNFYANNAKLTAVFTTTETEATTGTTYGNAANAGLYLAIAPGQYSLTGRIAAATNKDTMVDTFSTTIADAKTYSFYLSGLYDAGTKKADAFIVEDAVPAQDFSTAYVRLVHAIYNANPLTLYVRPTGDTVSAHWTAVGDPVAYKGGGTFVAIAPGVYDLGARSTDAPTTNRMTTTGVSLVRGQAYTVNARGNDAAVTGSTRDSLSSTAHF
jgi:hypothetical protein